MAISTSLLLATCVGCQSASAQPAQLPAAAPQPTAPFLQVPLQQRTSTKASQPVRPDAPIAVEWSARSRESSLGTVLKPGSRGVPVTRLQARLARLGYTVDKIDGIFGPKTQAMVMQFQRAHGLVSNGVVEATSWAKLNREITQSGQIQRSPVAAIAPIATPARTSPAVPAAIYSAAITSSASDASLFSQKTKWIVVLVIIQGAGWLAILQGLNKELVLLTGRSLFPDKTKQWLFSVRQ